MSESDNHDKQPQSAEQAAPSLEEAGRSIEEQLAAHVAAIRHQRQIISTTFKTILC